MRQSRWRRRRFSDEGARDRRIGLHRLACRRQADRCRPRARHLRPHSRRAGTRTSRRSSASSTTSQRSSAPWTGCTAVMHLAAAADVNEVAKAPVDSEACNARGTLMVLEAARAAEVARVIYASTIWVYTGESGEMRRRGQPAADARPPLHRLEARGRDVLHELRRAVRRRDDDPALRHPVRPARAAGGGRAGVRRQGARRRAADGRRQRRPVAALRLRRGPRRRLREGARPGRGRPHLQPRQRRVGDDPADRRDRAGARRAGRHRAHRGAHGRLRRRRGQRRARRARARLGRHDPVP